MKCVLLARAPTILFMATASLHAAALQVALADGVITYSDQTGVRRAVNVGKRCSDLWVAPDDSMLAFIAIEQSPGFEYGEPVIGASTIYIARKSSGFVPARIGVSHVEAGGRDWSAFRFPSVSPDRRHVFFFPVIGAGAPFVIFAYDLATQKAEEVGPGIGYCTVWRGRDAGSIWVWRYLAPPDEAGECYVKAPRGRERAASCAEWESKRSVPLRYPEDNRHGEVCRLVPR